MITRATSNTRGHPCRSSSYHIRRTAKTTVCCNYLNSSKKNFPHRFLVVCCQRWQRVGRVSLRPLLVNPVHSQLSKLNIHRQLNCLSSDVILQPYSVSAAHYQPGKVEAHSSGLYCPFHCPFSRKTSALSSVQARKDIHLVCLEIFPSVIWACTAFIDHARKWNSRE